MRLRLRAVWIAVALVTVAGCAAESDGGNVVNAGSGGAAGTTSGVGGMTGGAAGMIANNMGGGVGGASGAAGNELGGAGGMVLNDMGGAGGMIAGAGGAGGTSGIGEDGNWCEVTDAYEPLVARPGETCYEFLTHDGDGTTKFQIQEDESYNQFYYEIPWGADEIATRFGADLDNVGVLHHWLGFETDVGTPGTVSRNVLGTTLGENAKLFGGWAVGGCNVEFPENMGLELASPDSGKKIMIQWHHYNFTGMPQADGTKIQICTVPRSARPDIGSLTWLGTEDLGGNSFLGGGMPPGVESKYDGTCLNETSAPITIVAFWPHMHELGTNMYSEVIRGDGMVEPVFNKPFQFDHQVNYRNNPNVVLQPGDKIRAECTFFNNTAANVAFGQSTKQEMCYQFAFSYPAGALDKANNNSLIGATNTCWGDD